MSLSVDTLSLTRWRSANEASVTFSSGMTILVGENAAGKTNMLEAIQLLTSGRSFRHPRPSELVRDGQGQGRAVLQATGDGRVIDVRCDVTPERRQLFLNEKCARSRDFSGLLVSILFTPDDLSLVKGSASVRRESLDTFGRQVNVGYDRVVTTYARAIEQRNRLLKDDPVDLSLLDAWDESVSYGASSLLFHRLALFRRVSEALVPLYGELGGGEEVRCHYSSTLGGDVADLDQEQLRVRMMQSLKASRAADLQRGITLVGPQRDDIAFSLAGRDARSFASQGQQRSLAIAWKMAEVRVCEDILSFPPVLLLDDVMSELDQHRRDALCSLVLDGVQTMVTTTDLGYFSHEVLGPAEVVSFHDGTVE